MQYVRALFFLLKSLYDSRVLLWQMTKQDFRQRYIGSYLGVFWAFIQPAITIFIVWFVFQVGFKSMPVHNFPFVLWLVCGMIPWLFFNDSIMGATNSIMANSFLVKKVVFRVSLLPMIQICSALLVHLFFVAVLFLMFAAYGYMPSLYNLQVFYYLFAMLCFIFGLSLITSSLVVFMKDIGQAIAMILQFGFWGTPIFWNINIIPAQYQVFLKLNPLFYVIEGYRESFIYHEWFWNLGYMTIYFWLVTAGIVLVGALIFRRLRPHFADVL
jgi:lipopolysaccharide transport system permease protein/teichoic acid transport system permease protein